MDRIWDVDPNAPPINLLVYNGDSGLPSEGADGHLERYMHRVGFLEKLGDKERRKTIGRFTHHIWEYPIAEWQRIYTTIFGQPCTALPTCPSGHQFPDWDINTIGRYRGTGESQEHKALKERVMLERDRVIGKKALYFVEPEVGLSSGDIVDVFFSLPDEVVCVEVKSSISSDDDIRRGIFQCIKYQAVAQAEELSEPAYAKPRTVRALLIIGRKSLRTKRLRDLAAKLNVTVQCWG
ncbi:MAG: hypothetical protein EP335_18295 [Alphaproteobacteria bacterium]|nr:MAG: hypothetical protein EP335_18295 [Alphaproteobacteria bacterium]